MNEKKLLIGVAETVIEAIRVDTLNENDKELTESLEKAIEIINSNQKTS